MTRRVVTRWTDAFCLAEAVLKEIDIIEFYSNEFGVPLVWAARVQDVTALCPFCNCDQRGGVEINTSSGSFYCAVCETFAADIFAFMVMRYHLNFIIAAKKLAVQWSVA